jgi:hypothetical protein
VSFQAEGPWTSRSGASASLATTVVEIGTNPVVDHGGCVRANTSGRGTAHAVHTAWPRVLGAVFGGLGLLFFMLLTLLSAQKELSCSALRMADYVLALIAGLSAAFFGGDASIRGNLPIPRLNQHPISMAATGGVAVFLLTLLLESAGHSGYTQCGETLDVTVVGSVSTVIKDLRQPVADATVSIDGFPHGCRTDDVGHFIIRLPGIKKEAPLRVRVTHDRYKTTERDVSADSTLVNLNAVDLAPL